MTLYDQEHIEVEAFDREYTIEELLPHKLLNRIGTACAALFPHQWAVLTESGTIYHRVGEWRKSHEDQLTDLVTSDQPDGDALRLASDRGIIILFPIEYELEIKGYMAICDHHMSESDLLDKGRAGTKLLSLLMRLEHRTMLTSGLHGRVVEESYAELKKKAEQLSRSEEKYRNLAANLEFEVQKKSEEIRVAHANLMQQEKMAAIGQLSAGMAHEINNPLGFIHSNLTTLQGYTDDLATLIQNYHHLASLCSKLDNTNNLQPIRSQCHTIEQNERTLDSAYILDDMPVLITESLAGTERISKIVRDLKAVARPGETQPELINIHESIDAVLTLVQNRIGPKVEVNRVFRPVPLLSGFAREINQVWLNLILNALDALENQGTLMISTQADQCHIVVTISDTGIGISQEDLPRIFDPFFTTKEIGKGSGMGLHLVYHLIDKHGGRVNVHSELGQGSTFTIQLPVDGK